MLPKPQSVIAGPAQRGEDAGARFGLQAPDVGGPLVVALRGEGAVQPARRRQHEGERVLGDRPVVQTRARWR